VSEGAVWAVGAVAAYLAGSVPFGLLIGFTRGVDIRRHGSRNIGATNAGRVLGKKWGALCFALDVLKGFLPVVGTGAMAGALSSSVRAELAPGQAWAWLGVCAAAVAGHMFSVFLRFKGGKGVATGFGALLGVWPTLSISAGLALVVWLASMKATRIVSVSSILAAASLPLTAVAVSLLRGSPGGTTLAFGLVTGALGGLVIWKHRANVARLRAGTEPRVGREPKAR